MAERSDQPAPPSQRGPWPEVTEANQMFDHGAPWCMNADGHAHYDYPDPEVHVPHFECRTWGLSLNGRLGLNGPDRALEASIARPFLFGLPRSQAVEADARFQFEVTDDVSDERFVFSLALGDGLRLVEHMLRLIDVVDAPIER